MEGEEEYENSPNGRTTVTAAALEKSFRKKIIRRLSYPALLSYKVVSVPLTKYFSVHTLN